MSVNMTVFLKFVDVMNYVDKFSVIKASLYFGVKDVGYRKLVVLARGWIGFANILFQVRIYIPKWDLSIMH